MLVTISSIYRRWLERSKPNPETEVRWGEFNKLREANKQRLKELFAEVVAGTFEKGSDEQLIGDLVVSGMDSVARNERGTSELVPFLEAADAVTSLEELICPHGPAQILRRKRTCQCIC